MTYESMLGQIKNPDFDSLLEDCLGKRSTPSGAMKYQILGDKTIIQIDKFPAGTNVYNLSVSSFSYKDGSAEEILKIVQGKLNMEKINKEEKDAIILAHRNGYFV